MFDIKKHIDKDEAKTIRHNLYKRLAPFRKADNRKAIWQLVNTMIPYMALWAIMIAILNNGYPYWVIIPISLVASLFLVRNFIFFHDCCHGSFFTSSWANKIVGYITGILVFTPYNDWRNAHWRHHATAGNLDKRGTGDIWTITVEEYLASTWFKRFAYRAIRNPLIFVVVGPVYIFIIEHRFWDKSYKKFDRLSIIITNIAILLMIGVAHFTIGIITFLVIQLSVLLVAGALGIWLFYVQHQFDDVYWARSAEWDPLQASLAGSSYYKLPKILQWFSGSIGLHHIHHFDPLIPNYALQRCYDHFPIFQTVEPITIRSSLASLSVNLIDEKHQRMLSFRALRQVRSRQRVGRIVTTE
ncbi:fatty acid desaturase [candidate division KSB1 bacterium]|nr:fatty acid desaturase [candidate division KSB1 bacterium]